jgi:N-acetylmuramoyl-L-alanine amidase
MKIVDHLLFTEDGSPVPQRPSPNHGGPVTPELLVMHFTAGRSAERSIQWLTNPKAKASAHLVIAEDGQITQLVPFDRVAWHAGKSEWSGRTGVNRFSLGIELANPGNLQRTGSRWRTWFGEVVDEDLVMVARHKNGGPRQGWKVFTAEQLDAAVEVASLLVEAYGLTEIVGHDDVAPGRKVDPGPAFPMERFRGLVMGRGDEEVG